jgi:mRNA interferase MazF
MSELHFGDIVLLKFPFSDTLNFKKRPALIINEFNDGDIIVCRITSQQYNTPYDLYVENWDKVGLKLPSVIRIHKLATMEKDMVDKKIGRIDNSVKEKIKLIVNKLVE